ncbi:Uncharacterized protein FWK35_00020369 [Aphis craccivora]|uniref:Uncharacterized protein n=1 Tax=Aphis craccivora TaxID=307492 RepID=A0A6G0X5L6_APHCR|nr:Uncharacterized protein FWK35_00020369 [Aphis craccivora]
MHNGFQKQVGGQHVSIWKMLEGQQREVGQAKLKVAHVEAAGNLRFHGFSVSVFRSLIRLLADLPVRQNVFRQNNRLPLKSIYWRIKSINATRSNMVLDNRGYKYLDGISIVTVTCCEHT